MADISQIKLPDSSIYNIKDIVARTVMAGATSSADGAQGQVPAPKAGDEEKFLKGDGTWKTISASSTYTPFTGATSSAAGTSGLVPAPAIGDNLAFLCGDGTWIMTASDSEIDAIFTENYMAAGQSF